MATLTHPAARQSNGSEMKPRPRSGSRPPLAQAQLGGKFASITERGELLEPLVCRKTVTARLETLDIVNIHDGAHQ
jgi:hypothetical protein